MDSNILTIDIVADRGDGRTRRVIRRCYLCRENVELFVKPDDIAAYLAGEGYLQELFPYLSADEREMLLNGHCGPCFDAFCPPDE